MMLRQNAARLEVWAPAKLNLFLEVLGKRDDGFHEIETIMCPVNLFDTLTFENHPNGQLELQIENGITSRAQAQEVVPAGSDNLVVRAVERVRRHVGRECGARIRLFKRIPVAAGLAGGSSDAAAALVAANVLWSAALTPAEISSYAAELGSDVPFFLGDGCAACRGRGERIEAIAVETMLHFVIVRPDVGLSTAEVYGSCDAADEHVSADAMLCALSRGDVAQVGRSLHNRLTPAAARLTPWIRRLSDEFSQLDVLGHGMSGSGTTYFGICRSGRHARRIAAWLQLRGWEFARAVRCIN